MYTKFISPNKFILKVYSTIYLIILITYYKYEYFLIYNWLKLKIIDFSLSENDGGSSIYVSIQNLL
jgi:hypothetical protein